jgi:CheY-like chemotaxis protein
MLGINNLFQKQNSQEPNQVPVQIKKKVLIVEDEPDISLIYQQVLIDNGFAVFAAANGEEGLRKIVEISPDFILLDIMMPIMDGKTMLSHLKNDPQYVNFKNIPVVMLTNAGNTDNMRDVKTLGGASDFVIKSNINPGDVVNIVNRFIH